MNDSRNYPRVLIVGLTFSTHTGGGVTLTNLFRGWPKNRLAVASLTYDFAYPVDPVICERCYGLGMLEDRWVWPLSHVKRATSKVSGPIRPSLVDQATSRASSGSTVQDDGTDSHRNRFYDFIDLLGIGDLLHRLQVSPQFLGWVNDFQPEVIYSPVWLINQVRFVTQLVRATHTPLVIHVMDDWMSTSYRTGLFSFYLRWRVDTEFRAISKQASALLGISQLMCEAFETRYSRKFVPFHNPVDLTAWTAASKLEWNAHTPFRLRYAGTVGANNRASCKNLCRAVSELRREGHNAVLDMFIPNFTDAVVNDLGQWDGVSLHPGLPHGEMPEALRIADVLVLPLDFDQESVNAIFYSMPTKTAEYMVSGTPSLIYAPAGCAVSQYAQREGWGYVVSDEAVSALKEAIHNLMRDRDLRERLGRRGQHLAIQNHDATQVRAAFWQILASIATGEAHGI